MLKGDNLLLGRHVFYKDPSPIKYPKDKDMFEEYDIPGKFDQGLVGQSFLPLSVPTEDQFETLFGLGMNYSSFIRQEKLNRPDSHHPNKLVPPMYPFPYSKTEFDEKHCSGNYFELQKIFKPGETVTYISSKGPILKPAIIQQVSLEDEVQIEVFEYRESDKETHKVIKKVSMEDIIFAELAGPHLFRDNTTPIPKSIAQAKYDEEIKFMLAQKDVNLF